MASLTDDFQALLEGVLSGCPQAAERFCKSYQAHILRVVRRRLLPQMRNRFDSQDFVHDVWASFFANPPRDARFEDPRALIGYLERMAEFKIGEEARRQGTLKNDVQREQPLDDPHLVARQPTPSQIVGVEDEWEHMVQNQPPLNQNILRLVRHGLTYREIATRLNTNEKTIRRLLRRLDPRDDDT